MKKNNKRLTWKQQRFVEAYAGDGVKAAKEAGYKGDRNTLAVRASQLLKMPKIQDALEARNARDRTKRIADRQELLEMYSTIARDSTIRLRDRLKAMDSLARAQGMFLDKTAIMGQLSVEHLDRLTDSELIDKLNTALRTLVSSGIPIDMKNLPVMVETIVHILGLPVNW